jgi:pyridoxine kinase
MGVRATFGYDYNTDQGILLERILDTLVAPVQTSSYEIF